MDVTPEMVRKFLHYNRNTGVFTWKKRGIEWFKSEHSWRKWNTKYAGQRAGSPFRTSGSTSLYRCIKIFGRNFLEHRLAWLHVVGDPIPKQIDHRNRIGTDNRWSNLRPSDNATNSKNASMHSNNTSGHVGVCWNKQRGKWQANGKKEGKTIYLGLFDDIEDAAYAAREFRSTLGYDPGHGRELAHYHQADSAGARI